MQHNLFIVGWASHPSPQKEMVRTVSNCWSTFGALNVMCKGGGVWIISISFYIFVRGSVGSKLLNYNPFSLL